MIDNIQTYAWRHFEALISLRVTYEDFDQIARMRRLI